MNPADAVVQECAERLRGRRVLLCVGGGIAAYKACEVARLLVRAGALVDVAMTEAAQQFVTPLTLQALTQRPVASSLLDAREEQQIGHIALADAAELVLVAPATADLLARMRMGLANDVVTSALLATPAPVLIAPAMNVRMWSHPATRENVAVLAARGCHQVGPGSGEMACGHVGDGRMAEPWEVVRAAAALLGPRDFAGIHVLVTAGPTREPLDPVRFISNPSTGRMGYALAAAAQLRGARVTLVSGPVALEPPAGVTCVKVETAAEMAEAVRARAEEMDLLVMAAAVGDYRAEVVAPQKVKKAPGPERLTFVRTEDILAGLGDHFDGAPDRPFLVGFAAETERLVEHARDKLLRKRVDLIVANLVAGEQGAFGAADNSVTLVTHEGAEPLPRTSKQRLADMLLDRFLVRMRRPSSAG